jgi:hypothetical protein
MEIVNSILLPWLHLLSLYYAPLLATQEKMEEKLSVILPVTLALGCLKENARPKERSISSLLVLLPRLQLATKESTVTFPSVDMDKWLLPLLALEFLRLTMSFISASNAPTMPSVSTMELEVIIWISTVSVKNLVSEKR